MHIDAIAEALSEQVGFTRGSNNPDSQGWRDIVEFLFEDEVIKRRLLERYADRIHEQEDAAAEAYEFDEAERQHDSRLDRHYFELAQALARQEARRTTGREA